MDLLHQTYLATTSGIDETLQGISTDPFGQNIPSALGLRIPPVLPGLSDPTQQPRYLFVLASRTLYQKTTIRGIRQGLTIGVNRSAEANRVLPYEMPVTSRFWKFPDGNVSWHLVREPNDDPRILAARSVQDAASWRYLQADQSAMLYKRATFAAGAFNPSTGAPLFYPQGLLTYTPPDFWAGKESGIADLGNMKSIVYPWSSESDDKLNIVVSGNCRVTLYASVLQTDPATRLKPVTLTSANVISSGITPEDAFVSNFTTGEGGTAGPNYWRIFGSILFDDAFGAD
jgi:hypothetical protein